MTPALWQQLPLMQPGVFEVLIKTEQGCQLPLFVGASGTH